MRTPVLERCAPFVVRALDAAEALCLVESPEFAQRLLLVICGHVLSGISGPEFVGEFRLRMPRVPVLVLSGTADADRKYAGIPLVTVSDAGTPDELRSLVDHMLTLDARPASRTA